MFSELSQPALLLAAGVFLLGWILGSISARLSARRRASRRDPRDDRIRSLEAELRIAHTDARESTGKIDQLEKDIERAAEDIIKRDNVISEQLVHVSDLKEDLKDSVKKTRQLRNELSDRAAESMKSEAKLREVETELELAQASTDLFATGLVESAGTKTRDHDAQRAAPMDTAESSKSDR